MMLCADQVLRNFKNNEIMRGMGTFAGGRGIGATMDVLIADHEWRGESSRSVSRKTSATTP